MRAASFSRSSTGVMSSSGLPQTNLTRARKHWAARIGFETLCQDERLWLHLILMPKLDQSKKCTSLECEGTMVDFPRQSAHSRPTCWEETHPSSAQAASEQSNWPLTHDQHHDGWSHSELSNLPDFKMAAMTTVNRGWSSTKWSEKRWTFTWLQQLQPWQPWWIGTHNARGRENTKLFSPFFVDSGWQHTASTKKTPNLNENRHDWDQWSYQNIFKTQSRWLYQRLPSWFFTD